MPTAPAAVSILKHTWELFCVSGCTEPALLFLQEAKESTKKQKQQGYNWEVVTVD